MRFILKKHMGNSWALCAPKGHMVTEPFQGTRYKAIEWANAWVSSFSGAFLEIEDEKRD